MQMIAFDHRFYTSFYPDPVNLEEEQAMQHWLENGQNEPRFANLTAWIAGTPGIKEQLTEEFSVGLYRQFNPDLADSLQHDS